jgi:hypothetical protein
MNYYMALNSNTHACKQTFRQHPFTNTDTHAVLSGPLWYKHYATRGMYTNFFFS